MFEKNETGFDGLYVLSNSIFTDDRGSFKKVFSFNDFGSLGISFFPRELYYSINRKNVIRGMHFQTPPEAHEKMVYVVTGKITDVCLDLRRDSPTYGKSFQIELSGSDSNYLYIPIGFAHGFLSHEEGTIVHYAQTSCYSKPHDCGVRFDSFGFDWHVKNPIVSDRDKAFHSFSQQSFF